MFVFLFLFFFLPFYYDLWAFSSCSKTYCGYCNRAKQLLTQVGATYKVIELDELSKITVFFFFFLILLQLLVWSFVPVGICFFDENISFRIHIDFKTSFFYIEYEWVRIFCLKGGGYELQSALGHWTGQSTVPNVFIEGKHIGGCDCELFSLVVVTCLSNFHGLS